MSCQHGESINCDRCEEVGRAYGQGFEAGKAAAIAQPAPVAPSDACEVSAFSSRVCERGQRGCMSNHPDTPAPPAQSSGQSLDAAIAKLPRFGLDAKCEIAEFHNGPMLKRDHVIHALVSQPPAPQASAQPAGANPCIVEGAAGLPLCVGTCAKQGQCIERTATPLSALLESLEELRVILQRGTVTIDKIHELGPDGPAEEAWQIFYDEILPLTHVMRQANVSSQTSVAQVNRISLIDGSGWLKREEKTTGANGWLLHNQYNKLIRALTYSEARIVDSALAATMPSAAPSGWISVDERLPEAPGSYLLVLTKGAHGLETDCAIEGQYRQLHSVWCVRDAGVVVSVTGHVSHWMPLPAAPASPQGADSMKGGA